MASPTASPTGTLAASPPAPPTPSDTPAPTRLSIAFVGDVMLDRDVEAAMHAEGPGYPFAAAAPLFEGVDLVVANLEGTFTDIGIPLAKQYVFATDPTLAPGLLDVPVWGVSLSNNHATDYGVGGLERTIETLDANGIAHFGAGRSEAEARGGVLAASEGGPTVAFLGYSDIGETVFASGEDGGVSRANVDAIRADVAAMRARPEVDAVVVTLHMGTEYTHIVTPRQQELARAAIEAGADLVVGHHPHVLQPVEAYRAADGRRGLILYSLGNFVFDLDADDLATLGEGPFQSVVAVVTFEAGQHPVFELRPARIDVVENRPRPATPLEGEAILALLEAPRP
ncbi:MAG: CapA family protein [Dehalococcoidia bacterium]